MAITQLSWEALKRLDAVRGGRHYLTPEGEKVPSVTTILSVINKPALVPWAARVEREMVIEAAANLYLDLPADPRAPRMKRDAFVRTLEQRIGLEKAHARISKEAADLGGQAHKLIEWNLRRELGQEAGPEPAIEPAAGIAFSAFQEWWASSGLKPLRVEQTIFHPRDLYAGTADLLAVNKDGDTVLVDFKTSKGIYIEYLLQVAAYAEAVNAMGHGPVSRGIIVRFPKTESEPSFNPARDIQDVRNIATLFQVFQHAMALWEWMQEDHARDNKLQDKESSTAAPGPALAVKQGSKAAGNGAVDAAVGAGGGDALPAAQSSGGRRRAASSPGPLEKSPASTKRGRRRADGFPGGKRGPLEKSPATV